MRDSNDTADRAEMMSPGPDARANTAARLIAFLERYKIIFEIGAATLLGLMAIVVSIAQAYWTHRQTKLLTLQTQIAEAQALPQFTLQRTVTPERDVITAENKGGLLRIAHVDTFDVLFLEIIRPGERSSGWVQITGYFDEVAHKVGVVPSPASFSLPVNAEKRRAVTTFCQRLEQYTYRMSTFYKDDTMRFRADGIGTFVRIEYVDLLNREQVAWFVTAVKFEPPGDPPVLPIDENHIADAVKDALEDYDHSDAIQIDRDVTPDVVCRIARVAGRGRRLTSR
jgi:hypothetical protein